MKKIYFFLIIICFSSHFSKAQIIPPYFNDFEADTTGWHAVTISGSSWQWDSAIYSPSSGKVWGVGIDTNYLPNTNTILYTPIFDFTSIVNSTLSFWQMFNTELYHNGTRMEYSINNGLWTLLGNFGQPAWYNSYIITSSGLPGWSGFLPSWQYASISLDSLSGNSMLQFRFIFSSDSGANNESYLINNFCISNDPLFCTSALGISETFFQHESFIIYPNPAKDLITIVLKSNFPGEL